MLSFLVSTLCLLLATQNGQAFLPTASKAKASMRTTELAAHADDRRTFMTGGIAAATSLLLPKILPANAADVDYKAVAKDIMDMVEKNPDWGPSKILPKDVM